MSEAPDGAAPAVTEDTLLAPVEGVEPETQEAAETDPADDAGAETTPAKPRKTAQERIDELTAARREAERDRDYYRGLAEGRAQPAAEAKAAADPGEPDPNAYEYGETDARFIRDHATYHARKAFREEQAKASEEAEARKAEDLWSASQAKAAAAHDDYDTVMRRPGWVCTPAMADAIKTSEAGGEVAYHLATNPDEARRIAALTPVSQIREIGRLEARFSTAEPVKTAAKTVTSAPAPTSQVRGAGGQFTPAPDTNDFAAFQATYGKR